MERALELAIEAAAFTLEMPADAFSATTHLETVGADSIAIVVIADRIEILDPNAHVDNDALLSVVTLGDIAGTISWKAS
jgi:hypothetical protein